MKLIICFLSCFIVLTAQSQTLIKGVVKDVKGNAIASATLAVKDSYDGGTADSAGQFSFKTSEKGEQILQITAIGYKPFEQKISLNGTVQTVNAVLKEEISEMKAVVITAGAFEASDKKRATVLNSIDIVTTASANADVTGAIRTLPGAQQVGESEGLFVRGGTAGETRTYIDGTLVNNFFYSSVPNIAQRGRFSPFIFKGTVFTAGGYSALYGQALSAALILESIDLPDRSSGNFSISPIGGSLGFQKLSKNKNASWGVNYGYTDLRLAFNVLKMNTDYFVKPVYHTGDANFRIKTSKTGMLKYYGYFSQNKVGVRNWSLDTIGYKEAFKLRNFNMYHNISWKEHLGKKWKFNGGVSYANNADDIKGQLQDGKNSETTLNGLEYKNFLLNTDGNYFNAKAVFERRLKNISAIRFGGEFNHSNDDGAYTTFDGTAYKINTTENLVSAFAETDVYLTNDLAAKFGGRTEYSHLIDKYNFMPRISLAYKLGKESQASLAYGTFYQTPERRYLPSVTNLEFAKATHYIAQYQKVSQLQTLRAEVFYKKYEDLVKTAVVNNAERAVSNNGYGFAKGFELFYRDKKTIKNVDYWISYSYLDTKRDFLNYPSSIEPGFAAKHTANLVVKKFVSKLKTQFNANYVWSSGRPYYNIRLNNANNKYEIYDKGRLIPYNALSFSLNYLPNIFKQGANKFSVFVFSITNVLGSKQVYGYNYSYNGMRKEAIVPPTKTFIYIGAFISFGVDRSQDAINNNL
jgi:vitamin B12 transporter